MAANMKTYWIDGVPVRMREDMPFLADRMQEEVIENRCSEAWNEGYETACARYDDAD